MAALNLLGPLLTDEEEKRLSKLRTKLFDWDDKDWKTLVRDETPSEVYSDKKGFAIYLGNCDHARDLLGLETLGVTYILNMAAGEPLCSSMTDEFYGSHFRCMRVRAGDVSGYNLSQHFDETWKFIEEAREKRAKILVHCVAGVSRSTTIVIAYLMRLKGWSLEKASRKVSTKRPKVYPNLGFIKQLETYQLGTVGKL